MAETKHTPGPWKANQINQYHDFEVTAPDRNNANGYLVVKRIGDINSEANARLIASAPEQQAKIDRLEAEKAELVEVARFCITEFQGIDKETVFTEREPSWWLSWSEVCRKARTALSKHTPVPEKGAEKNNPNPEDPV